ncbi:hypothetical protein SC1083_0604 [Aggregatibacter actinomycetemcomitans serotype e str. SC1083]|uniref:Uncharacterized protein n=1 Tax=Aggregatibacter actinomycetemcomitans serotype e str. SC1083 TaxID=907488 RepID=G4A713_AGGAC|nr:hypothetical protein SC1083_0604 [Aggregatibacter actinomycetemcomitans serotype e str. SC1083]
MNAFHYLIELTVGKSIQSYSFQKMYFFDDINKERMNVKNQFPINLQKHNHCT